jgi:hypothetical protein
VRGQWQRSDSSGRKIKGGETTNDPYAFLMTEPNTEVGVIHPKAPEALKLQRPYRMGPNCGKWGQERWRRMNAGLSLTITHNVIITDRSESGMIAVASILETCPAGDEHIGAWRNSTDRFFLFIAEHENRRISSMTARDIDHLLSDVLRRLLLINLKPPARVEVDVFCQEPDDQTIYDRIDKLLIATALDAGNHSTSRPLAAKPRTHERQRQESAPLGLSRAEREKAIRYLCRMWVEISRAQPTSMHHREFSGFENWLRASGFAHYLVTEANGYSDREAEAWFGDELTGARRTKG